MSEVNKTLDKYGCDPSLRRSADEPFVIWSIFYIAFVLSLLTVSYILWYRRRHVLYLKRRNFPLLCFMSLGVLANLYAGPFSRAMYLRSPEDFDFLQICVLGNLAYLLVVPLIVGPQIIRLELVRRRYLYNKLIAQIFREHSLQELSEREDLVIKAETAKLMSSDAYGIKLGSIIVALSFLAAIIYVCITCPIFRTGICTTGSVGDFGSIFFIIVLLLLVVFHLYVSRKAKGQPDPFGILKEIRYLYYIPVSLALISFLLGALDPGGLASGDTRIKWSWGVLADFAVLSVVIQTFPYQIYRSYITPSIEKSGEYLSLKALLNNDIGRQLFENHLVNEFSTENLTFWKAANWWKDKYDDTAQDTRALEAQNIFKRWIAKGSLFQVNVGDFNVEQVETKLNLTNVPKDIFDVVANDIYNLMESDSFRRFKNTVIFAQFIGKDDAKTSAFDGVLYSGSQSQSHASHASDTTFSHEL